MHHPLRFRRDVSSLGGAFAFFQTRAYAPVGQHAEIRVPEPLRQRFRKRSVSRLSVCPRGGAEKITDADKLVASGDAWIFLVKQDRRLLNVETSPALRSDVVNSHAGYVWSDGLVAVRLSDAHILIFFRGATRL